MCKNQRIEVSEDSGQVILGVYASPNDHLLIEVISDASPPGDLIGLSAGISLKVAKVVNTPPLPLYFKPRMHQNFHFGFHYHYQPPLPSIPCNIEDYD